MKKIFLLLLIIVLFTGCSSKVIDLSDEEMVLISESASSLLIANDRHFNDHYVSQMYREESEKSAVTAEQTEEPDKEGNSDSEGAENTEDNTSLIIIPKEDKTVESKEKEKNLSENESDEVTTVIKEEAEEANTDNASITADQLSSFYEAPELAFSYQGYDTYKDYPVNDSNTGILNISSKENYSLLVLKFGLENEADTVVDFDAWNKEITYKVEINDTQYDLEVTALLNDLSTYMDQFQPQEKKDIVLVAQIKDSDLEQIEGITLILNRNNKEYRCDLQ